LIALVAALAAALAAGGVWRWRDGRMRAARPGPAGTRLSEHDLGAPLGQRATLLQFSSEFCAPCRATRKALADVAARTEGVTHLELDVADRLDLVRRLDVRRTPTVFVLGPDGLVTQRASGRPRPADVLAAIGGVGSQESRPV
jgi:thiol-disulfide isomerase/thioredoxin